MRTQALLSMMVLAMAPAAQAETAAPAESCTLKMPLKATRPGGVSTWETLPVGTTLSMVSRKSDWSRVRHDDTIHIVATSQFNHACVAAEAPKTEPAKAETTTTPPTAPAAPAKTETKTEPAKTEPAKAETTTTTTAAAEPAKTEPAKTEPAKAEATSTTTAAAEPAKTETKSDAKTGPIAASATTKTETTDAKKLTTSPLPSSPSTGQLFVLGLLLLGAVFTGVFLRRRSVVEQSHLDVVATRTLGRGKQLMIVDAGDARLLLGVTEQGITLLSSTPSSSSSESAPRSSRTKLSLLTEEEEAANAASTAASFFGGLGKGVSKKVGGLWGRPPAGPPADWDSFDRILASTVPDSSADAAPPSNSRRSSERSSSGGGAADLAELAREMQKHGVRRSA